MDLDALKVLAASRDLAALLLLGLVLLRGIPQLVKVLNRVDRSLGRIEGKLGIADSDRIQAPKS